MRFVTLPKSEKIEINGLWLDNERRNQDLGDPTKEN